VDVLRDLWFGLTATHRLFFSSATPVGVMFFMVLGAVLR
jgi:hypothetical protein